MGTLSVKENFHFSAALRLPATVTREEREQRVNNVVAELGLQHCADTKVVLLSFCYCVRIINVVNFSFTVNRVSFEIF